MDLIIYNIHTPTFLPEDLVESSENIHSEISRSPTDPSDIDLTDAVLACPLARVVDSSPSSSWVIAALLKRTSQRVQLNSEKWQEGLEFWLPEETSLFCPDELIWMQIRTQREDIIPSESPKTSGARLIVPFAAPKGYEGGRQLHPAEITPAPGFGTIALICSRSDKSTRRYLMKYHDQETMLCTNVERSIKKSLRGEVDLLGAHCETDRKGRYQLHLYANANKSSFKDRIIQDSWVGLRDQAVVKIKSGLGL